MSHELFHQVTDRRPRATGATGGTLLLSILAHAAILTAVVVAPLMATGALPTPSIDSIDVFQRDALPPQDPPAPRITRTLPGDVTPIRNVAPVEAHDQILDEVVRPPVADYSIGVVPSTSGGNVAGIDGGVDGGVPQPPPPPPTPPQPIRVSSVNMPRKVHDVAPVYPQIAQRAGIEGVVIVEAVIAVDGSVRDARVLRSVALLDGAALDAVRQWRYVPTRVNGTPVPVIVTVTVQFRLQR